MLTLLTIFAVLSIILQGGTLIYSFFELVVLGKNPVEDEYEGYKRY